MGISLERAKLLAAEWALVAGFLRPIKDAVKAELMSATLI
jgi:hypothetical protein